MNPADGDSQIPSDERESFPTLSSATPVEAIGTMIGRYKLLSVLGEGGFGMVYLAEQQHPIKRQVALKVIKPGMDSRQVIARFEAERQALALLDHPNIARVFDAGTTEAGRPYFVMELVKGLSILEYCDRHKLGIEKRLELFGQVCEAVQYAHQKGIIHRDLKPSNILVSAREDRAIPVVIDFGVAKAMGQSLTERTLFTEQGQFIGTPEYMSPEQAEMTAEQIDTRSDIYSLGVILYELLAGTLPFEGATLRSGGIDQVRRILRDEEPKTPSTRLSKLGEQAQEIAKRRDTDIGSLSKRLRRELEWIPLKAMRKEPDRRYRSASEMADDIRNYLNGNPLIAGPESVAYRTRKFARRHAVPMVAAAAFILLVIVGLVVSVAMYSSAKRASRQAQENLATARRIAYLNTINQAGRELADGDFWRASMLLESSDRDLRGWEWGYLWQGLRSRGRILPIPRGAVPSPDGTRIAARATGRDWSGIVTILDTATGNEVMVLPTSGGVTAFSHDGTRLASSSRGLIEIWDLATASCVKMINEPSATSLSFSPDGKQIAARGYGGISIWDITSGNRLTTFEPVGSSSYLFGQVLAFGPDGNRLLVGGSGQDGSQLQIWTTAGTHVRTLTPNGKGTIRDGAWSPDGRLVGYNIDSSICVCDIATGEVSERITPSRVSAIAFGPDGARIAWGDVSGRVAVMNRESGMEEFAIRGHRDAVTMVAFIGGGRQLLSSSPLDAARIWNLDGVDSSQPMILTLNNSSPVGACTLSSDRSQAIGIGETGKIHTWNLADGRVTSTLDVNVPSSSMSASSMSEITWSDNRKRVAVGTNQWAEEMSRTQIRVWDCQTGHEVFTKTVSVKRPYGESAIALSPDGNYLAFVDETGYCSFWDIARKARTRTFTPEASSENHRDVVEITFSRDGTRLAEADSGGTIRIWDLQSGSEQCRMDEAGQGIGRMKFSANGQWIMTSNYRSGSVCLCDARFGRKIIECAHGGFAVAVDLSPDGSRLLSVHGSGRIEVWDACTGAEALSLNAPPLVAAAGFDMEGRQIIAVCRDGKIAKWDSQSGDLTADAQDSYARGVAHYYDGKYDLAAAALATAIEIDPRDYSFHRYQGLVCAAQGEIDRAVEDLETAGRLAPDGLRRLMIMGDVAEVYGRADRPNDVERQCRAILAVTSKPSLAENEMILRTMSRLARLYAGQGQHGKAGAMYSTMLETYAKSGSDLPSWKYTADLPDFYEADEQYTRARDIWLLLARNNPPTKDAAYAMNGIAWMCATCPDDKVRNGKQAVEYAMKACELTAWEDENYVDTLAAAYAESGNFKAAVEWQQKALAFLRQRGVSNIDIADYEVRLKLYQEGKPYRQEPRNSVPSGSNV